MPIWSARLDRCVLSVAQPRGSADPARDVLELGEDECGAGCLGDSAGSGGDVLEDCPALREQGEPTLAAAAQVAQQRVPGARVDIQFLVSGGVSQGNEDAYDGALVAWLGGSPPAAAVSDLSRAAVANPGR
jgi:hypothetical protein